VDAAASARDSRGQAARRFEWSGPYGEEFAPDKSASATTYPAELLTANVSGTSRRNVLGAIALEKNDRNFPQRSDDNRNEFHKSNNDNRPRYTAIKKIGDLARRYRYTATRRKTISA
jgi:hypothetical protein